MLRHVEAYSTQTALRSKRVCSTRPYPIEYGGLVDAYAA